MGKEKDISVTERGKVVAVNGDKYIIASLDRPGIETPDVVALYEVEYSVGDTVEYVAYNDGTGHIISRADGTGVPVPRDGEDAVLLRVDSSKGLVFKDAAAGTILSVAVVKGALTITNAETLQNVFGNTAKILWQSIQDDETDYHDISTTDGRIYDSGFKFNLLSSTIENRITFRCRLEVSGGVIASHQITISWQPEILQTIYYYLKQADALEPPTRPTAYPPPTGWTATEPTYSAGETSTLYVTVCTVYSNGTFQYSDVSKSAAFEAAKTAYNKAVAAENAATTAQIAANGKNKIFFRTTAPDTGMAVGDIWYKTDDGYSLWEYTSSGWQKRQLDTGALAAGSVTAAEINVASLSAISANIGTVTAGILKSSDYAYTSGNYSTAGMIIDLNNKIIRTPKFAVDNTGKLYATDADIAGTITSGSGNIGGWTIGTAQISKGVTIDGETYTPMLHAPASPALTTHAFAVQKISGNTRSYPFLVNYKGALYATDAHITGEITATSGTIGGWSLTDTLIYKTVTIDGVTYEPRLNAPNSPVAGNAAFCILRTENGTPSYPFRVNYNGKLISTDAEISGTITAESGSVGPWTIGSTAIYNGKSTLASRTNGTYIGTDGISGENSAGYYKITPSGSIDIIQKNYGVNFNAYLSFEAASGSDVYSTTYSLDYISLFSGAIWANAWNDAGSATEDYDPHIIIGRDTGEPKVYVGQDNGWSGIRVIGEDVNGGAANDVGLELWGGSKNARILIQGNTSGSNAYGSDNPTIEFQNVGSTQNLSLIFTDYDSVQSPASLTLAGNQGGEYFIAPYLKATSGLYVGNTDILASVSALNTQVANIKKTRQEYYGSGVSGTTKTVSLEAGHIYLVFLGKINTTSANSGCYMVSTHTANSNVVALAAIPSSVATVSISAATLSIALSANYVMLSIIQVY